MNINFEKYEDLIKILSESEKQLQATLEALKKDFERDQKIESKNCNIGEKS